jgi:FdhD protein
MFKKRATFRRPIRRVRAGETQKRTKDTLVAEEPFTVVWQASDGKSERLASTMRTPGDDLALAAGMLFAEGLLQARRELNVLSFCSGGGVNELNRLKAELRLSSQVVEERLGHRPSAALPQSACGMCGLDDLSSPDALKAWAASRYRGQPLSADLSHLHKALDDLDSNCPLFELTGASHACLLLSKAGELLAVGEDVGRHNACDKAIGQLFLDEKTGQDPFLLAVGTGVLFSSRLSFELASKAVAAGVSWMASVGAPTHMAVELAERCEIPLYGFLGRERHNRYTVL